jgi:hypothetical protein
VFQALDIDIPHEGEVRGLNVALRSWVVVYTYFWSAILLLIVCYTVTALLAEIDNRGNWRSLRTYASISILSRAAIIILTAVLLAIGGFKAELLFHSILHCKRMDSADSGSCILGHQYERPDGAFVDKKEREEH